MRILLYAHDWAPTIGGAQTYVSLLAEGLVKRSSQTGGDSIEVTVATPTPAQGMNDAGLPYRVVRRPGIAELARLIHRVDVVHLAGPCLRPLFLGWLFRKTVVMEHHGYPPVCPNGLLFYEPTQTACPGHYMARRYGECLRCNATTSGWFKSVEMLLVTFLRRWLCQRVASNIGITKHVSKRLELPRTRTVYYGIEVCEAVPPPTDAAPLCLAYLGRLVPLKGLPILLEASAQLAQQGYWFRVKFIGDGPDRRRLEEMTDRLGLRDSVVFTGYLEGKELGRSLRNVAVIVMPSIWEETAGLSVIEHMMRGRLVIASDIGGLGEIVGEAGLRFSSGNVTALASCMKQVLNRPELIGQFGSAARERALSLFRKDRMVEEHLNLYRRLTVKAGMATKTVTLR